MHSSKKRLRKLHQPARMIWSPYTDAILTKLWDKASPVEITAVVTAWIIAAPVLQCPRDGTAHDGWDYGQDSYTCPRSSCVVVPKLRSVSSGRMYPHFKGGGSIWRAYHLGLIDIHQREYLLDLRNQMWEIFEKESQADKYRRLWGLSMAVRTQFSWVEPGSDTAWISDIRSAVRSYLGYSEELIELYKKTWRRGVEV